MQRLWGWIFFFGVAGLLLWTTADPGAKAVDPLGGSALPCQVPIPWEIGRLDPEFGLGEEDVALAVRNAARLWEEAAGRAIFPEGEGLTIHLVFDDRQAGLAERETEASRLASVDAQLEERRTRMERDNDRLEREIDAHNERVRALNESGGAPPEVIPELERIERDLERRRSAMQEEIAQLNADVERRNADAEALARAFPPSSIESGSYSETIQQRRGRLVGVADREIQIFRFVSRDHLVLLLAHELGHALGLGHVDTPEAVMAPVHESVVTELHPADRALLAQQCSWD